MAKQKKDGGIDLANIEANLDDVFAALGPSGGTGAPAVAPTSPAQSTPKGGEDALDSPDTPPVPPASGSAAQSPPSSSPPPAAPPERRSTRPTGKRGAGAKSSGKPGAKVTEVDEAAATGGVATVPTTGTEQALSAGELAWFFRPPDLDGGTTQVYLSTPTKEALFAVARRVGGIPAGQLADNILRWWIINNKRGLRAMMERDPLEELEL